MSDFRKTCPACKEDFSDLKKFMEHLKRNHRGISPTKILEMGKEQKWGLRS